MTQDTNRAAFEALLPEEFKSGNDIPVERATFTRSRMVDVLQAAIAHYRQQRGEPVANAEMLPLRIAGTFCNHLDTALDQSRVMAAAREIAGFLDPQPAEPVVPEYMSAMGIAGQAYLDGFKHAHALPSQFRWSDLWAAMYKAAPQPAEPLKCDGDHGGPRCADPECWNDSPVEPVKGPSDADIIQLFVDIVQKDEIGSPYMEISMKEAITVSRALLDRYGAQPAASAVPEVWIQRSYLNFIRESNVALHNVVVRGSRLPDDGDVVPLYTAPVAAQPSEGWKLVPVEPTAEMYASMVAYDGNAYSNPFDRDDFLQDYAAMLATAPEPPQ